MGTRADFYVGTDPESMEWLGSIAWDGYPDGIPEAVLGATTEDDWRREVAAFLADRDDGTTPDMGWPWPWDDSGLTDCPYTFAEGRAWMESGGQWEAPIDGGDTPGRHPASFPNMSSRKAVTLGARSGLMVFR